MLTTLLFASLLSSTAIALEVSLSSDKVSLNKTLRMTISDRSSEDLRNINLQPLEKDFDLGQPSFSSEISIINGQQSSQQTMTISLQPKRPGSALIPPLRLGNKSTKPVRVTVTEAIPNPSSMYNGAVKIEASVSKTTPYVGEQFTYTLKIFHRVAMENTTPQLVLSNKNNQVNASIDSLAKKEYQVQQNQQRYAVQEWRYVVSLDQAGKLTIPSPVVKGELYEQRRSFFRTQGVPFEIEAKPITINVRSLPPNVGSALVAESLELREQAVDRSKLQVGQPITRTIEITAKGLKAEHLPSIILSDQSSFNVYSEPAVFDNEEWLGGYSGTRRESFAIIPTQPGPITLPEISIDWFNSKTGRMESSVLPSLKLNIAPAAQQNNVASDNLSPTTLQHSPELQTDLSPTQAPINGFTSNNAMLWATLFALATLAWLVTFVVLLLLHRRYLALVENSDSHSTNLIDSQNLRQTSSELKKNALRACKKNDLEKAKLYTLLWKRQVIRHLDKKQLAELDSAMNALDQLLFSASGTKRKSDVSSSSSSLWSGEVLAQILKTINPEKKENPAQQLKPLYPNA